MPDGSPRYEYIVQVEPELLATLADGQSIPIVADVPEQFTRSAASAWWWAAASCRGSGSSRD